MPAFQDHEADIVHFSGKQAEEIGFEKFHRRQAKLHGIHVLVLDRLRITHRKPTSNNDAVVGSISDLCANITELDLSGNLFETFDEIIDLCSQLPKLKVLTLNANRISIDTSKQYACLETVRSLSLSRNLLDQVEVNKVVSCFPSLESLTFSDNEISGPLRFSVPLSLRTLDLSDNQFASLSDVQFYGIDFAVLHTLILKRNRICRVNAIEHTQEFAVDVLELDLSYNAVDSWKFFDTVDTSEFRSLEHLRVASNPLYQDLVSAEGKPLAAEDGYMLTLARLPQLKFLNYAKITEKERLNAETYYLGQIAIELSNAPEDKQIDIVARHPRYFDLCSEYGEPAIHRKSNKDEIDPNTLAARLVTITFTLAPYVLPMAKQRTWIEEIPKSFQMYSLHGVAGKQLRVAPLRLRLILQTNESDPVGRDSGYSGPEWWDSSDDEAEGKDGEAGEWVKREVELIAGTRTLGTYVEGMEATVRIEIRAPEF